MKQLLLFLLYPLFLIDQTQIS